jgi:hypothetical protein
VPEMREEYPKEDMGETSENLSKHVLHLCGEYTMKIKCPRCKKFQIYFEELVNFKIIAGKVTSWKEKICVKCWDRFPN